MNWLEHTDAGDHYKKPIRNSENEVHDIRIYCNHKKCKQYIKGKEGYNGSFITETGHRMDLRNDMFICTKHEHLYEHLRKKILPTYKCKHNIEFFRSCEHWIPNKNGCMDCSFYNVVKVVNIGFETKIK